MAQNGVLKPVLILQMAAGYSAYIPKLYATQTDNESIDVSVKLMDKTVPYIVPEGYQVNLRAKKPDGTVVFQSLSKSSEFYILRLGGQLTTAVGIVEAAVEVVKGSFVLNSARFEVDVKPRTVNDGDIASEDDLTALNEYVDRSETAAESAETAADRAETAADQADQAVQSIGTATEDVKKAADSAALSASSAAQSAMEAGQSKTDAGKSAENAAASATAAAQSAAAASQSEKAAGQAAGSASQSALAASNSAQTASDKAGETKTSAQDASDAAQAASSAQTAAESAKTAAETAKGQAETQAGNAAQSAQEASASASAAAESAAQAAASAEQADLAIKTAIKLTKTGELVSITDSIEYPFVGLTVYGKSTQDGVPSPENPVPIVSAGDGGNVEVLVTGKNLLDISKMPQRSTNGITFSLENGGIKISGTATANTDSPTFIFRLPAGTYISNMKKTRFPWLLSVSYVVEKKDGSLFWLSAGSAFTVLDEDIGKYFYFRIERGQTVNEIIYPQLEVGSTVTPYESYKSQSPLTIPTPNGLPGVPVDSGGNYTDSTGQQWLSDIVDFASADITHNVGKISSYNGEDVGDVWMSSTGELTTGATVLYKLDEPYTEPIPAETLQAYRTLHTYHPNTNIFGTDNVGLKAQYVADTELFVNNLLADIASLHAVQDAGLGL